MIHQTRSGLIGTLSTILLLCWSSTGHAFYVGSNVPSRAIRNYHTGILHRAEAALLSQALDLREFQSCVFSLSEVDIPKAKKMMREFVDTFRGEMHGDKQRTRVYCLGMQLFDLGDPMRESGAIRKDSPIQ